jgi:hypothetical protein
MGYKVVGKLIHDDTTFEHGDSVSESKVGGKENFDDLVAAKTVVTDEEFKQLFPGTDEEVVDPSGTPSNLRDVEGTKLQANRPEGNDDPNNANVGVTKAAPANPANPPEVKGAGDPKAAAKEQEKKK